MRKIIVTGDLFRVCPVSYLPNQRKNILFFYHLLSSTLFEDMKIFEIKLPEESFEHEKFYNLFGQKPSEIGWSSIYETEKFSTSILSMLDEVFTTELVVGYELPTILKNYFEHRNITYFDFSIHPVRFLDDLLFSIESNCENFNTKINKYKVDDRLFYKFASLHKAKMVSKSTNKTKNNSALIIGQTEVDKSLIKNGKCLNLMDFIEKIKEIKTKYSTVYFKPHPYSRKKRILNEIKKLGVVVTYENIYKLLTDQNIEMVAGISSSVLYEAKFFNKEVNYFLNPKQSYDCAIDFDTFTDSEFWSDLLDIKLETKQILVNKKPNRIRDIIGMYWGYDYLEYSNISDLIYSNKSNRISFLSKFHGFLKMSKSEFLKQFYRRFIKK